MAYPHVISVNGNGKRILSIFLPDERQPIIVPGDHPNYERLLFEAEAGDLTSNEMIEYVLKAESSE
jgi:hypothetical protein